MRIQCSPEFHRCFPGGNDGLVKSTPARTKALPLPLPIHAGTGLDDFAGFLAGVDFVNVLTGSD